MREPDAIIVVYHIIQQEKLNIASKTVKEANEGIIPRQAVIQRAALAQKVPPDAFQGEVQLLLDQPDGQSSHRSWKPSLHSPESGQPDRQYSHTPIRFRTDLLKRSGLAYQFELSKI